MSAALVALGAPVQSASGAAVTGLAYGQPPTAGNVLVCWWIGQGATTAPSTPGGWTVGQSISSTTQLALPFWKIAAGNDAVPAFGLIASSVQTVMLGEFSGNIAAVNPRDRQGGGGTTGASSPFAVSLTGADTTAGELVIYACGNLHSASVTDSCATTLNGTAANDTTNNATSTVNHFDFGWGVTTSNAAADSIALTRSVTSLTSCAISGFSFRLPPAQQPQLVRLPRSLGPAAVGPTFFAPTAQQQPAVGFLLAWYAADQITGLAHGQPVATWTDVSGNGNAATQATASLQPTFLTNQQNGLPAVGFGGGPLMGVTIPTTAQPVTVFAVVKYGSGATTRYLGSAGGAVAFGNANLAGINAGVELDAGSLAGGAFHSTTVVAAGTNSIVRLDGAQTVLGTAGPNTLGTSLQIGARGNSTQTWNGYIAEIIVYRGVLSPAQILAVESYLNTKWFSGVAQPAQQSFLPRTAGPEAVGATFFAPLYVPWTPPPLAQPVMSPTESAITAAVIALTAASAMVVTAQGVTASTVSLTAASQIAPTAQSVSTAAVPLTAASLMTPTATAQTAATVPVSAPALFTVTAQAKTSSTVSLTAASNMTVTVQSTTATTVPLTAAAALTPIAQAKTSSTAPLTVPGVQFLTPTAQATTAAGAPLTAAAQLSPAVTAMAAAVAAVTAPSATVPALLVLTMGSSTRATVIITTPFVPPPPEGRRQRIQTVFVRL